MKAVLFPGQGSQYVGMGSDFYAKFDSVKKIFDKVDKTLNFSLSKIILNGPESELKLTQNTQPAIMTIGVSIFEVLKNNFSSNLNNARFFAGHSLGEYTALATADVLSFSDTLKILKVRGNAMQSAVPKGEGGMLAILGSDLTKIEKIIQENKNKYECFIANDNSEGQVVASGKINDIDYSGDKEIKIITGSNAIYDKMQENLYNF